MAQVKVNKVKRISYNQHAWPQVHDRQNFSTEWVVRIKIEFEFNSIEIGMNELTTYLLRIFWYGTPWIYIPRLGVSPNSGSQWRVA